jgi:hypothetical protein
LILSYSLYDKHVPLHIIFLNFMFSYINFYHLGWCCVDPICAIFLEVGSCLGYILYPNQGCQTKAKKS